MRWRSCLWIGLTVTALLGLAGVGATITVNPGQDIQAAINGASAGDTIQLAAGVHDVAATINVSKAVTIDGSGAATVRGTAITARNVFKITASNVTLQNMDITLSATYALAALELDDALVAVPAGAGLSNVVVQNNMLYWPAQAGAMGTWGGRAITIGGTGAPGIVITGNTVYNTRNGIVVQYNNPAVITDNLVYNTKGGVMNYTNNQADADTRSISGNTWGTVHNEWDIVWNSGGAYFNPDYHHSVYELSLGNNDAYVVDRRDNNAPGYNALGNRSHIFVSTTGTATIGEVNGNMNVPYATLASAMDAVVAGGTVYVGPGNFQGAVIAKQVHIDGADAGGTVIASGVGYSPTNSTYKTAFRLDAGANGTVIDDVTVFCALGSKYYFAAFGRNVDNVRLEDFVIYDTVQGVSNWGGDGWEILNNQIIGTVAASGGGIGFFLGVKPGTNLTCSDNLLQGNTVGSDASAPDYSCPGIVLALDLRYGSHLSLTGNEELTGNQILGNTISDGGVVNGVGIEMGVIMTGIADALVPGLINQTIGMIHHNAIVGNTVSGEYLGVYLYTVSNTDVELNVISGCTSAGVAMYDGNVDNVFHFNSITGNAYGLWNETGASVDAALNWWGDASGPSDVGPGSGDAVSADVVFSPWLGANPDGDALLAGVQITAPLLIIVDDVGPAPAGGYLDAAIAGSNSPTLAFDDTILVLDGDFTASTSVTDGVTLVSAGGACRTTISGILDLRQTGVTIGRLRQGFEIHGAIGVSAGVDASTIHINWNDIYDVVTNGGTGRLDATFNYWGEDGPDTVGFVDVHPYLPVPSCTLIGYMDDYGFRVMEAITFADLLLRGLPVGKAELAILLMEAYGLEFDDAMGLVKEYGLGLAKRAFHTADTLEEFLVLLTGYKKSGGGGGGGAADGGQGTYTIGSPVPLFIALADPFTGEPVTDAIVSFTVTRMLAGGTPEFVSFGVLAYDATAGGYSFSLDTTGFAPGEYTVWIGTDDGRFVEYEIVLVE